MPTDASLNSSSTARVVIGELAEELRDEFERPPANLLISRDYQDYHRIEARLVALEQASASIRAVERAGFFRPDAPMHTMPRNREGNRWHKPAIVLAKAFIKALKETNPGVTIGVGKEGPVTRFIAKIMQFITGERPKLGAIEKHLREHLDLSDIQ